MGETLMRQKRQKNDSRNVGKIQLKSRKCTISEGKQNRKTVQR